MKRSDLGSSNDEALLLQAHEGSVYGEVFSPDSKLLKSVSSGGALRLWSLRG